MSKSFFEVFPTLKLDTGLQSLFEDVYVERVTSTKRKDFLRVYIASDHLIHKEDVFRVEREIGRQFFPHMPIVIKFYERFTLSSQYDQKKLMDVYRESILLELRESSPVEYSLFKRADMAFEGSRMLLTVEDTVFGREKAGELSRILEKIYNERCGIELQVDIDYKEKKAGKNREEDEHRIALQVAEISARAGFPVQMKGAALSREKAERVTDEEPPKDAEGYKDAGQAAHGEKGTSHPQARLSQSGSQGFSSAPGKSAGFKDREKGDYRRPLKRSDNPDVIYGRDFEEEAMPIEDIIGEMGEVVIRGQVIRSDQRSIKNERTILIYDVTDYTDTMTVKFFARND